MLVKLKQEVQDEQKRRTFQRAEAERCEGPSTVERGPRGWVYACTAELRDFTLSHPPALQINGLHAALTAGEL